jgi:hypothetical protein
MKGLQNANAYWGGGATDCRLREVQLCCSWMSFALVVVVVVFSALMGGKISISIPGADETQKTINFGGKLSFILSFLSPERIHCSYIYFHCS